MARIAKVCIKGTLLGKEAFGLFAEYMLSFSLFFLPQQHMWRLCETVEQIQCISSEWQNWGNCGSFRANGRRRLATALIRGDATWFFSRCLFETICSSMLGVGGGGVGRRGGREVGGQLALSGIM